MLKARVAVFVSGGGTNLQAMLDKGLKHGEIALVVSRNPDAYALERARLAGVETLVIAGSRAVFERAATDALRARDIRFIVLAGFLTILSEQFIEDWAGRVVNVHPSLIPAFCGQGFYGLRVHEAALARGVKLTGATVHLVNAEPDGGPILAQKAVRVHKGDTPEKLQRRVMERAEWILLPQAVEKLCERWVREHENADD